MSNQNPDGEPVQQLPPVTTPPVVKAKVNQNNQIRRPGWNNRVAPACGRG